MLERSKQAAQLYGQGDMDSAEALWRQALQEDKQDFSAYYGLGLCLLNKNLLQAAHELLSEAIGLLLQSTEPLTSNTLLLWKLRADACFRLRDYEGTVADCKLLLFRRPQDSETRRLLALALLELNETQQAKEHLQQVLREQPHNPAHLVAMGVLRMREGEWAEAIAVLGRAREAARLKQSTVRPEYVEQLISQIERQTNPAENSDEDKPS